MSYTVKEVSNGRTGDFHVTIEKCEIKEFTFDGKVSKAINLKYKKLNGGVTFDHIYEKNGEWDTVKMDKISKALRITAGTNFNSIQEWLNHIENKQMSINIKESLDKVDREGNPKLYISFYKPVEDVVVNNEELYKKSLEISDDDLPF